MNRGNRLSEFEVEEIRKLACDERQKLGFLTNTPIANDMSTILENLGIILLEYPIKSKNERQAFSAAIMYSKEGGEELVFIGLNTADYYDKQIFALAHELYHYFIETGSHLSRIDIEVEQVELKANLFAAEFLLPETTLKSIVIEEFKLSNLESIKIGTIIRFVARLQCTWWLPYRSLVKRLKEVKAISEQQFNQLYNVKERDIDSDYFRIGKAINSHVFLKLNEATNTIGTSAKDIEVVIRNFEDDLIDEEEFSEVLQLFRKTPDEYGFAVEVDDEDVKDFDEYFSEENVNES